MYGREGWTIKKAECQRIDAFELWCWRRLLRVPWTARRSNQLILKEVNPDYSLEGLMLKLKLQYFGHLIQRADTLEKTLMLGKIEDRRRRGLQRMRWLDGTTDTMDMSLSKLHKIVKDREPRQAVVLGVAMNRTPLNDWTTTRTPQPREIQNPTPNHTKPETNQVSLARGSPPRPAVLICPRISLVTRCSTLTDIHSCWVMWTSLLTQGYGLLLSLPVTSASTPPHPPLRITPGALNSPPSTLQSSPAQTPVPPHPRSQTKPLRLLAEQLNKTHFP